MSRAEPSASNSCPRPNSERPLRRRLHRPLPLPALSPLRRGPRHRYRCPRRPHCRRPGQTRRDRHVAAVRATLATVSAPLLAFVPPPVPTPARPSPPTGTSAVTSPIEVAEREEEEESATEQASNLAVAYSPAAKTSRHPCTFSAFSCWPRSRARRFVARAAAGVRLASHTRPSGARGR